MTQLSAASGLDEHLAASRLAQRRADKWLISGSLLIGTAALGIFGLPLFLRGVWLLRRAQRDGLTVRPMLVTLLGYLVIIDAAMSPARARPIRDAWRFVGRMCGRRAPFAFPGNMMEVYGRKR